MANGYDPEFADMVKWVSASDFSDVEASRRSLREMLQSMNAETDLRGVLIEDRTIAGIDGNDVPVRIYSPEHISADTAGVLHMHGGGFAVGDLDSEMGLAVGLCRHLGVVVVSVDYRLAPEHPYPAGLEDCYSALCWMRDNAASLHIDLARLAVLGFSAGGGLAAAVSLLAKDRQGPELCFQCLLIPELDDRLETHSMRHYTDTPLWNRPNAVTSWRFYLGDGYVSGDDNVPIYAAPARASLEQLTGLPPAYVTTMQFDPLRDEGIEYAMKLLQAGTNVELHNYPGTFHGSFQVNPNAEVSQREMRELRAALSKALNLTPLDATP